MLAFIIACEIGECTSSCGVAGVDVRLAFQEDAFSLPTSITGHSAGGVLRDWYGEHTLPSTVSQVEFKQEAGLEREEDGSLPELQAEFIWTWWSLHLTGVTEEICFVPPRQWELGWNAGWTMVEINDSVVVEEEMERWLLKDEDRSSRDLAFIRLGKLSSGLWRNIRSSGDLAEGLCNTCWQLARVKCKWSMPENLQSWWWTYFCYSICVHKVNFKKTHKRNVAVSINSQLINLHCWYVWL